MLVGGTRRFDLDDFIPQGAICDISAVLGSWCSVHGVESHGKHCLQRLHPVVFNLEAHVKCKACPFGCIDEIQDMDLQVNGARVSTTIEMTSNVLLHVPSVYAAEMGLEPVHQGSTGLTYILFLTLFARNAVD